MVSQTDGDAVCGAEELGIGPTPDVAFGRIPDQGGVLGLVASPVLQQPRNVLAVHLQVLDRRTVHPQLLVAQHSPVSLGGGGHLYAEGIELAYYDPPPKYCPQRREPRQRRSRRRRPGSHRWTNRRDPIHSTMSDSPSRGSVAAGQPIGQTCLAIRRTSFASAGLSIALTSPRWTSLTASLS